MTGVLHDLYDAYHAYRNLSFFEWAFKTTKEKRARITLRKALAYAIGYETGLLIKYDRNRKYLSIDLTPEHFQKLRELETELDLINAAIAQIDHYAMAWVPEVYLDGSVKRAMDQPS